MGRRNYPTMGRAAVGGWSRMMRTAEAGRLTAAAGTFLDQHQFGMKIIGQGNHEEEQHHGADECRPFAPGGVAPNAALPRPASAPENHPGRSDQDPENIEK
ncbi:MAG: hypothetical protein WCA00_17970 [Candidatus Acidiferrales bacterium]